MNPVKSTLLLSALALTLSACGGGGGGSGSAFRNCVSISGGNTSQSTESQCTGCSLINVNRALDGNFGSFATLNREVGSAGVLSMTVTAQDGVVFPAGNNAGLVITSGIKDGNMTVRTYSNGVLGQTGATTITTGDRTLVYVETLTAFDAVEFELAGDTVEQDANIFEFCSNADGVPDF